MHFIITIDTEGDNQWSEAGRRNITTENAKHLPRFQSLCEEYGFKPTYLTSYEMLESAFFIDFARVCLKKAACEIGVHPHAWNCPPQYDLTGDDPRYAPYLMEYPKDIIVQKTRSLKEALENEFETHVVSHRSGRWAISRDYVQALDSLQFKVDCSVTPHFSWVKRQGDPKGHGGTDFTGFPSKPYFIDLDDISRPGGSQLLEIPMTISKSYRLMFERFFDFLMKGSVRESVRSLVDSRMTWFRPGITSAKQLLKITKSCSDAGDDYVMLMLHSSEFMPGANPFSVSVEDVDRLFVDIEAVFDALHLMNVTPVTCGEYYRVFKECSGRK